MLPLNNKGHIKWIQGLFDSFVYTMVLYYRPEVQGTSYNKQIQFHSKRDGKRITESIHQILNYVKKEVLELKRFLKGNRRGTEIWNKCKVFKYKALGEATKFACIIMYKDNIIVTCKNHKNIISKYNITKYTLFWSNLRISIPSYIALTH